MNYNSFNGHSKNSLNKNRIVVPKDFKNALSAAAKQTFYLVPDPKNKCFNAFPADVWIEIINDLAERGEKAKMKTLLKSAVQGTLEGDAGRVRLPEVEMAMLGIKGSKVHFFGEGQYFSIYGEEEGEKRFHETFNKLADIDFDEF